MKIEEYSENAYMNKANKKKLHKIFKNGCTLYYHFLPKIECFEGGIVNFRKINSISVSDFNDIYIFEGITVSPAFIKDISSRFSVYYARQGQPDFNMDILENSLTDLPIV